MRQLRARPMVRAWLLFMALCVLAMVVVGGATRLTESGLSITEWNVVTGALPPLGDAAWQSEFQKYQQIPQYQLLNAGMTLSEFKFIYYWEWGHRLLGRAIGFVFLLPFLFFVLTGRLERRLTWPLVGLFVLGGLQGALGWYMVASGLVDRVSVSPYRLAAHLGLAAAIFALLIWVAQGLRSAVPELRARRGTRVLAGAMVAVVFLQILLGGLVAGLDAGFAYNTWPLMDGAIVPDGLLVGSPWWINIFENVLTVQFEHRIAGYAILVLAIVLVLDARRGATEPARRRTYAMLAVVIAQVALGVFTLLTFVDLWIALLHQAGAMVTLALAVAHLHALRGEAAEPSTAASRLVPDRVAGTA